jgi:hypothetical protein
MNGMILLLLFLFGGLLLVRILNELMLYVELWNENFLRFLLTILCASKVKLKNYLQNFPIKYDYKIFSMDAVVSIGPSNLVFMS